MKVQDVKIKKTKKNDIKKSGYYAVFGDEPLADIFRKVQSTTIRNGNELQNLIKSEIPYLKLDVVSFDEIIEYIRKGDNFYAPNFKISKKIFEKNNIPLSGKKNIDVDAIAQIDNIIYIIEYKDGDALDTKKSQGEIDSLNKISNLFSKIGVETTPKLVMWRCDDVKNSSFKSTDNNEYLIIGKDMSSLLNIDFEKIQSLRDADQKSNRDFVLSEIKKIIGISTFFSN